MISILVHLFSQDKFLVKISMYILYSDNIANSWKNIPIYIYQTKLYDIDNVWVRNLYGSE